MTRRTLCGLALASLAASALALGPAAGSRAADREGPAEPGVHRDIASVAELGGCLERASETRTCALARETLRLDAALDGAGAAATFEIPDRGPNMQIDVICPHGSEIVWNDSADRAEGDDVLGRELATDRWGFKLDFGAISTPGNRLTFHHCTMTTLVHGREDAAEPNETSLVQLDAAGGAGEMEVRFLDATVRPGGMNHVFSAALGVRDSTGSASQDLRLHLGGGSFHAPIILDADYGASRVIGADLRGKLSTNNTHRDGLVSADPILAEDADLTLVGNTGRELEGVHNLKGSANAVYVGNMWYQECAGRNCGNGGATGGHVYSLGDDFTGSLVAVGDSFVTLAKEASLVRGQDGAESVTLRIGSLPPAPDCPTRLVRDVGGKLWKRFDLDLPIHPSCEEVPFYEGSAPVDPDANGVIRTPQEVRRWVDGSETAASPAVHRAGRAGTPGCLVLRDDDDAGWSECATSDGALSCNVDANESRNCDGR